MNKFILIFYIVYIFFSGKIINATIFINIIKIFLGFKIINIAIAFNGVKVLFGVKVINSQLFSTFAFKRNKAVGGIFIGNNAKALFTPSKSKRRNNNKKQNKSFHKANYITKGGLYAI